MNYILDLGAEKEGFLSSLQVEIHPRIFQIGNCTEQARF